MSEARLTIISPVLNEARHIEAVVLGMKSQTRPPDEWIVVDDGSDDGTLELLRRAALDVPFMRVVEAPATPLAAGVDRLHHAAEARAFNHGLSLSSRFTHVGKLDGDIELPPDYYERLLVRFRDDGSLGLAGGVLVEPTSHGWELRGNSDLQHVRGALKLYTRDCFETIGGVREMLGWDGVDEVLARMHGYRTRSFPDAVARHHRPVGTAQGRLRGSYRLGRSMFIEGYPLLWIAARSLKVGKSGPLALTGVAYLAGYVNAGVQGVPRFDASGYRQHLRRELRGRVTQKLKSRLVLGGSTVRVPADASSGVPAR
jgi:glycosyltransferase involved in cell wall biosynthesis